jgi:hypothetical protein
MSADLDTPTIPLDFTGLTPEDFEHAREWADRLCYCKGEAVANYECGEIADICLPCAYRVLLNDMGRLKMMLRSGH